MQDYDNINGDEATHLVPRKKRVVLSTVFASLLLLVILSGIIILIVVLRVATPTERKFKNVILVYC